MKLARRKAQATTLHAATPLSSAHLRDILEMSSLSRAEVSQLLGASLISVVRWERGDSSPGAAMARRIEELASQIRGGVKPTLNRSVLLRETFPSHGARARSSSLPLFSRTPNLSLERRPGPSVLQRLTQGAFWQQGQVTLQLLLRAHPAAAPTLDTPAAGSVSAGKNTYTYDAHTYHTKVPPQGIAEILRTYLPHGGLVLDPFAGSGMTGVAAQVLGYDAILNELSPAASFIADRFTTPIAPDLFASGVRAVCDELRSVREALYETQCRECGRRAEILFTVWSYRVRCYTCKEDFLLWDHCRRYGRTVREHKILSEFLCPACDAPLKKSRLPRTVPEPVLLGYRCCSRTQVERPLSQEDRVRLREIVNTPPLAKGFYPTTPLPDGVNLGQPKRHGLTSIDRFYTPRNLAAMSHLWRTIHRVADPAVAGFLAFTFTSLYQRVTQLSEFRFWGGSGNTAHFNVPYIFNEANVFVTFERKARTIQDHLETTAARYRGRSVVRTGSATDLHCLPDNSIDLVFTDPPFGANINYSEMNILWESWLDSFTDSHEEAIINAHQCKSVQDYQRLMRASLSEAFRVLRPEHWLLMVFMNSSKEVWRALRAAVVGSGFAIERIDIFDKQHGTFKQFVSENTAGADLILHCRKPGQLARGGRTVARPTDAEASIDAFLKRHGARLPTLPYLHVEREEEIDYRQLYSEWLAASLLDGSEVVDFARFREVVARWSMPNAS